jgi:hypothetical protein
MVLLLIVMLSYISLLCLRTLYSSRQTMPVASAVAVAMAGMMRPAMSFAFSLST